ncbi:MAG TPA: hypothetical protein VFD36_19760 [Kofleriaceae bacterium]|nr:hypothetical protein [Kofleriaceae bacterium]
MASAPMLPHALLGSLALCACATATGAPRADTTITVGGAEIAVELRAGHLEVSRAELMAWVTAGAGAVAGYYGRFPVGRYRIAIQPVAGEAGVLSGTTWSGGGAHSRILVGEHTTPAHLARDWVMTHEMIHTAFPEQPPSQRWIEEGTATYVEPLARAWAGGYPATKVWADLVGGLPRGLPARGDRGLDHTHTWGRTYWGGALFCLLADIEIRERTDGRRGLVDALRGIIAAGGNSQADWTIERTFAEGDRAIGVPVLQELYRRMKDAPVATDLDAMWRELGVALVRGKIELDDSAPKAAIRRAISAPR